MSTDLLLLDSCAVWYIFLVRFLSCSTEYCDYAKVKDMDGVLLELFALVQTGRVEGSQVPGCLNLAYLGSGREEGWTRQG